jgi:hypothetical protein
MTAPAPGQATRSKTDFSLNSAVSLSDHSHSNLSFPHRLNSATHANHATRIQKFASNPNFSNGDVNAKQINFYRRFKKISTRTPEEELIDERIS